MKKTILLLFLFFTGIGKHEAFSTTLSGEVAISFTKESIDSRFIISNYESSTTYFSFMLYDDFEITQILLNGEMITFTSIGENCDDCNVISLDLKSGIKAADKIEIHSTGKFKSYKAGENTKDYKGLIANNYGILRATEQSKWYPTIIDNTSEVPLFLQHHYYTYNLKSTCDCDNIYIGKGQPQTSGSQFKSTQPLSNIMLIAGNYKWAEGKNGIYINVTDKKMIKWLDKTMQNTKKYYEKASNIPMTTKFTFAHLPSDNPNWEGFLTYPTIGSVNASIKDGLRLEHTIAHEVAHYLFSEVYKPKSTLYWFYLESFAEYYACKFWIENRPVAMFMYYWFFKKGEESKKKKFVRLDQVNKIQEVNETHRYQIGSYQLLAIENQIGEAKMLEFINTVFPKIQQEKDGYKAMIESFQDIGVDQETIQYINEKIIKQFSIDEYKFLKKKIRFF